MISDRNKDMKGIKSIGSNMDKNNWILIVQNNNSNNAFDV